MDDRIKTLKENIRESNSLFKNKVSKLENLSTGTVFIEIHLGRSNQEIYLKESFRCNLQMVLIL